jgi:AcrR family transcriptional regulator
MRLITVAIRLFGQRGFEAASTRQIATAAGLNTPALQYYFDNKEGLYAACAEHIASNGWEVMKEVVESAEAQLAEGADDEALIEAYCVMQARLADFFNDASGDWLLWMTREQTALGSSSGYLMNHPKIKRMIGVRRAIVARLLHLPVRHAESVLQEMALTGHLLHFYIMRPRMMRALGWKEIDAERLQLVKRVAWQHTLASLRSIVATRAEASGASRSRRRSGARAGRRDAPVE